jgi:hypothetical protein
MLRFMLSGVDILLMAVAQPNLPSDQKVRKQAAKD